MDITGDQLRNEYEYAHKNFGDVIEKAEDEHKLPRFALYAFGSKETNFDPYYADGAHVGEDGHGHGFWQEDDRSHTIPRPFGVKEQAETAAALLKELMEANHGDLRDAADAYNAGQGGEDEGARDGNPDKFTTGGDYGSDVADRFHWLQQNIKR